MRKNMSSRWAKLRLPLKCRKTEHGHPLPQFWERRAVAITTILSCSPAPAATLTTWNMVGLSPSLWRVTCHPRPSIRNTSPPLLDLDLEDDPSDSPFFRTRDGGRAAFPDYFLQSSKSSFAVVDGLASGEAEISDLALWYSETKADLAGSAEFLDDEFDLKELTSLRRSSEDGTTSGDAVDDGRMSISAPPVVVGVGVGATEEPRSS